MAYEEKNDAGALFKNKNKAAGDKRPDYKGPCKIDGVELDVSAWLEESKNGVKYMSLKFEPRWKPQQQNSAEQYRDAAQPSDPARQGPHDDSDRPF